MGSTRGRVLAGVGTALALSVAFASPAAAAPVEWKLDHKLDGQPHNTSFADVAVSGPHNAWAVGYRNVDDGGTDDRALVYRGDGSAWQEVGVPTRTSRLTSVATTSPQDVWAVSDPYEGDSAVLRWDGASWTKHSFPGSRGGGVAALAGGDVWYVAGSASGEPGAHHWDGEHWTPFDLPGADPDHISSVSARSSDDVWAVGTRADQPYAAHWDGERWQELSPPRVDPPQGATEFSAWLSSVAVTAQGDAWVVGSASWDEGFKPLLYRFDGSRWNEVELPDFGVENPNRALDSVGTDARGRLWLAPEGWPFLFRWTGDGWEKSTLPEEQATVSSVNAIDGAGGRTIAVGETVVDDLTYYGVVFAAA